MSNVSFDPKLVKETLLRKLKEAVLVGKLEVFLCESPLNLYRPAPPPGYFAMRSHRRRVFIRDQDRDRPLGEVLAAGAHIELSFMTGIAAFEAERTRQLEIEGFTPQDDDKYQHGELVLAAKAYLMSPEERSMVGFDPNDRMHWPWDASWWKPSEDRRRDLEKAGALMAAEWDRLNRAAWRAAEDHGRTC